MSFCSRWEKVDRRFFIFWFFLPKRFPVDRETEPSATGRQAAGAGVALVGKVGPSRKRVASRSAPPRQRTSSTLASFPSSRSRVEPAHKGERELAVQAQREREREREREGKSP